MQDKRRKFLSYLGEVSLAVADQETRLSATAITNHDNLLGVDRTLRHMGGSGFSAGRGTQRGAHGAITRPSSLLPTAGGLALESVIVLLVHGLAII
jgi:phage baseplate assembly protein gpV